MDYEASDSDEEENGNDEYSPSTSTSVSAKNGGGGAKRGPTAAAAEEDSVVSSTSSNGSPLTPGAKRRRLGNNDNRLALCVDSRPTCAAPLGFTHSDLDSEGHEVARDTIALMEDAGMIGGGDDDHPLAKKLKFEEHKPAPRAMEDAPDAAHSDA